MGSGDSAYRGSSRTTLCLGGGEGSGSEVFSFTTGSSFAGSGEGSFLSGCSGADGNSSGSGVF